MENLTLLESGTLAKLIIPENYTQYSLLNLNKFTNEKEIIDFFNMDISQVNSIMKKETKWVIISENETFNKNFENTMRNSKINGVIISFFAFLFDNNMYGSTILSCRCRHLRYRFVS